MSRTKARSFQASPQSL
jgi:hypothetical protein